MIGMVVPLRSARDATSALPSFDVAAVDLLTDGRAETLSAAQFVAILANLHAQRGKLIAGIDDLEVRPLSGDDITGTLNANLSAEARKGLASIDAFIQHAEACAATILSPERTV